MSSAGGWAQRFADYPAANLVTAIGVKYYAKGAPPQYSAFDGTDTASIREIAGGKGGYLAEAIFIAGENPGAESFEVLKRGAEETLTINYANRRQGVMDVNDGPAYFEDDDWDPLRNERGEVKFALPRKFVEEMSANQMLHAGPIGEAIFAQTKHGKTMDEAVTDVLGLFDADRVESGSRPRRWGLPGLRRLRAYLSAGGDPAATDMAGLSALAVAIFLEQADAVRELVDAGVDINAPAAAGLYPIDVAILSGDPDMVTLCVELGALPNHCGYIQPAFRAIDVINGATQMFACLLRTGADLDVVSHEGLTLSGAIDRRSPAQRGELRSILTTQTVARAMDACVNDSVSQRAPQIGAHGAAGRGGKTIGMAL